MGYTLSFLTRILIAVVIGGVAGQLGANELVGTLRDWVERSIYFGTDKENREVLFVRAAPVRAFVGAKNENTSRTAKGAISNLAKAFRLDHDFGTSGVNLLIVDVQGLLSGKENSLRPRLRQLGVPQEVIEKAASHDWSMGCGSYSLSDSDGRLGFSIVAIDDGFSTEKQLECVLAAAVQSFGLGIRITRSSESGDYVQFLLLAASIGKCDPKTPSIGGVLRKRTEIVDCIVKDIQSKLLP